MKKYLVLFLTLVVLFIGGTNIFASEKVEITWLVFETPNLTPEFYESIISKFEAENPNITIKRELYDDPDEQARLLYSTGQLPDVMLEGARQLKQLGALMELPDELTSLLQETAKDYVNGKIYSMPLVRQIYPNMFYNKDIFKKYDLTPPETWDDFVNICETLKNEGVVPIIGAGPHWIWLTGAMVEGPKLAVGLHEYDPNWPTKMKEGELKWTSPVVKEIFEEWKSLIDNGYYHEGSYSFGYDRFLDEFMRGNGAMICNGSWFAAVLDKEKLDFKPGWFALPGRDKVKYYPVRYQQDISIPADTEHPEEAIKFVKFLFSNKDVYRMLIQVDNSYSTLKESVTYEMGEVQKEMLKGMENLEPVTYIHSMLGEDRLPAQFRIVMGRALQNIFVGAPVEDELRKMEEEYRTLISGN